MGAYGIKPFRELRNVSGIFRLDWFGGIAPNPMEADNPLIDCYFTPVKKSPSEKNKKGYYWKVDRNRQERVSIAVGYLPSLFLGQHFKGGQRANNDDWENYTTITVKLDNLKANNDNDYLLSELDLHHHSYLLRYKYFGQASKAGVKKLNGQLLDSSDKATAIKLQYEEISVDLVIHEMELIRFYLTNSSFSCKNIFSTAFTDNNLFTQVINNAETDFGFNPETKVGRFVYRHEYSKEDATTLGRILFDPTALKAAQRISKQIAKDRINFENGWLGYPRTYFPFEGTTQLQVSGRYLRIRNETRDGFVFLVHRILACSAPFPFEKLSYCNALGPGGGAASPDSPEINWSPRQNMQQQPDYNDTSMGNSVSNQSPSAYGPLIVSQLGARCFHGLEFVEDRYEKGKDCTHRSGLKLPMHLNELLDTSTGKPTTGDSDATPQKITERNLRPSTVTADLQTFVKIIQGLKKNNPGWEIKTLRVGMGEKDNESKIIYSLFPAVPCQKKIKIPRQFSFMDKEKTISKRFICVEINIKNHYCYLFEAQRRLKEIPPKDKNKSPYKENLPILLLRRIDNQSCIGTDFLDVINDTVEKETWPNQEELVNFIRDHTVHGRGAQSTEDLISRVTALIKRNIPIPN